MAYLKQNVSFYGTEDGLLMHLKNLFTNSAFSINCIEENYDTLPHYIILGGDTLRLKICSEITSLSSLEGYRLRVSMGFVNSGSNDIIWLISERYVSYADYYVTMQGICNRQLCLLIVKTGTGTAINIGGYNSVAGKGNFNIFIVENEDAKLHTYSNGIDTYAKVISNNNADFYFRPHHICGKNSNEFFLDCEISALYTSNNAFITHSTDITGLGGAVAKNFYIMTNGDKYYAVADNIAIRLGEEVVIDEE